MLRIEERPDHVAIDVSDTLTKSDYDYLVPRLERWGTELSKLFLRADVEFFAAEEEVLDRAWLAGLG